MKFSQPLFETVSGNWLFLYRLYAASILVCICFVFASRVKLLPPSENGTHRLMWIGCSLCELAFFLFWIPTVVVRWDRSYRRTFKDRLSERHGKDLPAVDILVCTADPVMEPPSMVMSTVLSVMAYDYPPDKLSVFLSDDGCSDLTFYAMLEAASFSKKWIPFCHKFKVEPRSPEAYFSSPDVHIEDPVRKNECNSINNLYEEMVGRVEAISKLTRVPEEIRKSHQIFKEWDFVSSRNDHQTILQIVIDGNGRDETAVDDEGQPLPSLVYLSREKRPHHHHQFKAGAVNALIRVSSRISNAPIILNLDCDMYSNNPDAIREALCFLMDEESGPKIGFVQFPQNFVNLTRNDLYGSSLSQICNVELHGFDSHGGPCFIGTGCFHRRDTLSGKIYTMESREHLKDHKHKRPEESATVLEEEAKRLADCDFEYNTLWGKEMGFKYGALVEDILTGLSIQRRGWRSVYHNPAKKCFLGLGPTTLLQSLIQQKRWAEGQCQILLSRYFPLIYGWGKIPFLLQLSYCIYSPWSLQSIPFIYYFVVPSLCLLRGISLFPEVSSPWGLPFTYIIFAVTLHDAIECISCGATLLAWWNGQRMWMFKRTTSYLFALLDNIWRIMGFTNSAFAITAKVTEDDVSERYEKEMIEFGAVTPMFTIIAAIALINGFCLIGGFIRLLMWSETLPQLVMQMISCASLVLINLPVYEGLFFRKDPGRMPASVMQASLTFSLVACSLFTIRLPV
ncbi:hypothetical protein MLD38_019449 [Melastoma candidum]|uniref:Uncharacterized protein n=1 Tax=Melastoma candidum TaxID=119954 RepID=A0ACB9QY51_9MYRT|nr:hypothetical protein MLD38_019449 [Melastoma candidum]